MGEAAGRTAPPGESRVEAAGTATLLEEEEGVGLAPGAAAPTRTGLAVVRGVSVSGIFLGRVGTGVVAWRVTESVL